MKNSWLKKYIIFLILLFIAFLGILLINKNKNLPNSNRATSSPQAQSKTYETKTDTQGTIEVEVTPKVLSSKENSTFEVAINNHQVDLNYDLAKIAVLTDDKGNKYLPVSWSGKEGGHHSAGILVFSRLSKDARSVKLTIISIAGVDRVFAWDR
ncbi:MAG: hypothetical protein M1405_03470 [Patescibacteria group bacterium]|nr:hypothetical protein [Patescibacteria group bacterium]